MEALSFLLAGTAQFLFDQVLKSCPFIHCFDLQFLVRALLYLDHYKITFFLIVFHGANISGNLPFFFILSYFRILYFYDPAANSQRTAFPARHPEPRAGWEGPFRRTPFQNAAGPGLPGRLDQGKAPSGKEKPRRKARAASYEVLNGKKPRHNGEGRGRKE